MLFVFVLFWFFFSLKINVIVIFYCLYFVVFVVVFCFRIVVFVGLIGRWKFNIGRISIKVWVIGCCGFILKNFLYFEYSKYLCLDFWILGGFVLRLWYVCVLCWKKIMKFIVGMSSWCIVGVLLLVYIFEMYF